MFGFAGSSAEIIFLGQQLSPLESIHGYGFSVNKDKANRAAYFW